MSDLIERSAVIDLIDKYTQDMSTDYWTANYGIPSGVFEDEIMDLPSAQTEPKEGHWIDKGWNGDWAWQIDGRGNCWRVIECSKCGKSASVESNFCPHCGAYMKGGAT